MGFLFSPSCKCLPFHRFTFNGIMDKVEFIYSFLLFVLCISHLFLCVNVCVCDCLFLHFQLLALHSKPSPGRSLTEYPTWFRWSVTLQDGALVAAGLFSLSKWIEIVILKKFYSTLKFWKLDIEVIVVNLTSYIYWTSRVKEKPFATCVFHIWKFSGLAQVCHDWFYILPTHV